MMFKKWILASFKFMKKMYWKLFDFMIEDNKRIFYRFYVHFVNVILFLFLLLYLRGLITHLMGEVIEPGRIVFLTIGTFCVVVLTPCLVKLLMYISKHTG